MIFPSCLPLCGSIRFGIDNYSRFACYVGLGLVYWSLSGELGSLYRQPKDP